MIPLPVVLVTVAVGLWFVLFGATLLLTRPRPIRGVEPTPEVPGEESPAVVNLLANGWRLTPDAAESTLLDLASRGWLHLRADGDDPARTTVHVVPDAGPAQVRGPLRSYEQRVLQHVATASSGGGLPVAALTFRDRRALRAWQRDFTRAVADDARQQGLSRRRWSGTVSAVLVAAAFGGPAVAIGPALGVSQPAAAATALTALTAGALLTRLVLACNGERDTPAGRERARRWLGLRRHLEATPALHATPPAAVGLWGRYLAYAQALGVAPVCSAALDLGEGNRRRLWSAFGGTWHRVEARYPWPWGRYGCTAPQLFAKAYLRIGFGVTILFLLDWESRSWDPDPLPWDRYLPVSRIVAVLLLLRGVYIAARTLGDLARRRTVTGQVLALSVALRDPRRHRPGLFHLVLDDGTARRTTAWALGPGFAADLRPGQVVAVTVRPWSRTVTSVTDLPDHPDAFRPMVSAEMSAAAAAAPAAVRAPATDPAPTPRPAWARPPLLSADDVATATERPRGPGEATGTPLPTIGSMRVLPVPTPPGSLPTDPGVPVLQSGGIAGVVLMAAHRLRGTALPGIGDEAYQGPDWVIGRRGDTVVRIETSTVEGAVSQGVAIALLRTALSRAQA